MVGLLFRLPQHCLPVTFLQRSSLFLPTNLYSLKWHQTFNTGPAAETKARMVQIQKNDPNFEKKTRLISIDVFDVEDFVVLSKFGSEKNHGLKKPFPTNEKSQKMAASPQTGFFSQLDRSSLLSSYYNHRAMAI